jgi:hypothetical protein
MEIKLDVCGIVFWAVVWLTGLAAWVAVQIARIRASVHALAYRPAPPVARRAAPKRSP